SPEPEPSAETSTPDTPEDTVAEHTLKVAREAIADPPAEETSEERFEDFLETTSRLEPPESDESTPEVPEPLTTIRSERPEEAHRRAVETTPEPAERVIETRGSTGPALAALAAAELLSRSRDKKLREEAEKTKERVKELEK